MGVVEELVSAIDTTDGTRLGRGGERLGGRVTLANNAGFRGQLESSVRGLIRLFNTICE